MRKDSEEKKQRAVNDFLVHKVQRAELFVQNSQLEPYLKKLDCTWSWVLSWGIDSISTTCVLSEYCVLIIDCLLIQDEIQD